MKLKKIASLMLAGVMAVSMLAGCGEGSSSSSEPTTPPVTTTGLAAALNNARTDYAKNALKLTYEESSSLAEILSTAAHGELDKKPAAIKKLAGSNCFGNPNWENSKTTTINYSQNIRDKIAEKLTGGIESWGTSVPTKNGEYNYARVYMVGGNWSIEEAATKISKSNLNGLESSNWLPVNSNNKVADYTADVAAVKVTSADDASVSLWVVAVVYTQTVSDAK